MTQDRAVVWMAERGITCYQIEIHNLQSTANELRAEAGRYGDQCEATQKVLKQIADEIQELKQAAYDRYDDWGNGLKGSKINDTGSNDHSQSRSNP